MEDLFAAGFGHNAVYRHDSADMRGTPAECRRAEPPCIAERSARKEHGPEMHAHLTQPGREPSHEHHRNP
jgi:hypothetical protein